MIYSDYFNTNDSAAMCDLTETGMESCKAQFDSCK